MTAAAIATRATTALAENTESAELSTVRPPSMPLTLDQQAMDSMIKLAEIMATGKATVPAEYRGNPGDCLAVVMQAVQWRMNPYAVAQKTHFVSGKIGYEAQLINAVITSLAPTEDRIHYEWYGPWEKVIGKFEIKKGEKGEYRVPAWHLADEEGIGVKAWATIKGESEPRMLDLLLAQARTRNSTLWADDPRQQLAYLAVKRWARLYTPDVIMGVYSPDEVEEIRPASEKNMGAAEVVRDKLGGQQAPDLPTVLESIAKAATPDKMQAARVQVAKLADSSERKQAGETWKSRLAELKAADKKNAETVDTGTGEIIDQPITAEAQAGESPVETTVQLASSAATAEPEPTAIDAIAAFAGIGNVDKLDEYMDQLPAPVKQDPRVAKKFKERRDEIKAAKK
jgi:hypothetical protein